MRRKVMAAITAGAILVGAGVAASMVSAPQVASAQESDGTGEEGGLLYKGLAILEEVLAGLVDDGTIDESQADAIVAAVEAKAEEIRAEREARRELMRQFAEDGVFTADELAQLGEDHPFNDPDGPYAEAAADGELTLEEIRRIRQHPRWNAFRHGARLGALLDGGGIDQEEYDALPDGHPLKQVDVTEYLADGLITPSELREIHSGFGN